MTNFEKETNINYNAGEDFATVYSANDSDIRRFDKLVAEREEVTCTRCVTALDNSHTELNAYIKVSNPASSFGTRIDGSFAYFSSAKKSTATAMNTASQKSKEVARLQRELDKSKESASIKAVEIKTKKKFDWKPLRNYCNSNELEMPKIFDANYGSVRTYPAEAWLTIYKIDLKKLF